RPKTVCPSTLMLPNASDLTLSSLYVGWTGVSFAADQQQIARVDRQSKRLSGDKDRVPPVDGVSKEGHPARQAEIPKGDRSCCAAVARSGSIARGTAS